MARLTLTEQLTAAQDLIASQRKDLVEATVSAVEADKTISGLRTELASARERAALVAALTAELDETKKKLASAEQSKTYNSERAVKAENEIEQAHAVLDGVTGAPSRSYEMDYGKGNRNVVTRLAGAFLAIAKNGGAA